MQIFRDHLNLDEPVWERYGVWIGDVARGDLGRSLVNDETVTATIGDGRQEHALPQRLRVPPLRPGHAHPGDARGALPEGKLPDSLISVVTLIGLSLPEFVLGTLLIFVFAVAALGRAGALDRQSGRRPRSRACTRPCFPP